MVKILQTASGDKQAVLFETKKEADDMILIVAAAITGKPLNKKSRAYKMAQLIDDEFYV